MSLKGLTFMEISKEKYNIIYRDRITKRIDQKNFREFINAHKNIFKWKEETSMGKDNLDNLDNFPNKESILRELDEFIAFAYYKKDKGYFGLDVVWIEKWGIISMNFNNSRVTIEALEILLDMANYCDAMLLVNGKKQITKDFIEKEKNEIEEKKKK